MKSRKLFGRFLNCTVCVAALLFLFAPFAMVAADDNSGTKLRLLRDIKFLSTDEMEGRGVGTNGINDAAKYIREQFQQAGLKVDAVDGGAFQKFQMTIGSSLGKNNAFSFKGKDGKTHSLKMNSDFRPLSSTGTAKFSGEIVFCGYGVKVTDGEYDDFKGVDLKGKAALIMMGYPTEDEPQGKFKERRARSRYGSSFRKSRNAFSAGAAAVIFVHNPATSRRLAKGNPDAKTDPLPSFRGSRRRRSRGDEHAVIHVTQKVANQLLEQSGSEETLESLEAKIDKDVKPHSFGLDNLTVECETTVVTTKAEVKNVIGVLEGEGPLADETIVVGAHYDHVGFGRLGGSLARSNDVHNGADDNGSGTVSLMELARKLSSREKKLPRRIVFIAFTAEERGLLGSKHYVDNPIFPLEKTIAMYNMDMVGRIKDKQLTVFGVGTAKRFQSQVAELGDKYKLTIAMQKAGNGPSDHQNFFLKKVPVLHFFSNLHEDYHRPSDDWEKINIEGMEKVVNMLEEILVETALNKKKPVFVAVKGRADVGRPGRRRGNRPYFGSIPDFAAEVDNGFAISGVSPNSPAARAGLKPGDIIVKFGTEEIGSLKDFDGALRKYKAGDTVEVTIKRGDEKITVKAKLMLPN